VIVETVSTGRLHFVLLVIFGAGASYDSVLHYPPPTSRGQEDYRPPLANQLFDDRPQFVEAMNEYPACKPLVNRLRGNVHVEQQLAKFEQQAKTFPARRSQLAAIRYYLHFMLWNCERNWFTIHNGITNYSTLLDEIDRWRVTHNEQVCYVTFNYDTMVEQTMAEMWGWAFDNLDAYTSNPRFKLIKLHGSIDWGFEFMDPMAKASNAPQKIIRNASKTLHVDVSERYRKVVSPSMNFDDGTQGFPALAIPVEKKSEFSCPPEHLTALANALPNVTKIITIGWRATEQHFLTMLKKPLTGLQGDVDRMVVSGDIRGVTETNANLGLGFGGNHKYDTVETGFSGLIRDISRLEAFLT
jgi:hypothetical protein